MIEKPLRVVINDACSVLFFRNLTKTDSMTAANIYRVHATPRRRNVDNNDRMLDWNLDRDTQTCSDIMPSLIKAVDANLNKKKFKKRNITAAFMSLVKYHFKRRG